MNQLAILLLIFAVRLASVFIVRTYYVPDEYWQSLEVAHKLTFGFVVGAACIAVDTYLYGKVIVTPFEFLKYNIFHNIGSFYGTHPWYWYLTTGLPTVLGITTLPFIFGVVETVRQRANHPIRKLLLIVIVLNLVLLSLIDHKEFRFVASLLPLCLYICADSLARWSYKAPRSLLWVAAITILVGNVLPAWYLSAVHQKGPIELMPQLHEIAQNFRDENNHRANVLFLMPCHSTPYYSHIHENITLRFLTCEPNLENQPNYKDEADQFYESPVHFLRSHIPSYPRTAMPSHVVLFEPLAGKINEFLINYKVVKRIANAEHVPSRHGKNILVYQRLRPGEENEFNRESETKPKQTNTASNEEAQWLESTNDPPNSEYEVHEQNLFN